MPIKKLLTENKILLLDSLNHALIGQGSINVTIKKYFTTVDGAIIAKTAAPAVLQADFPVYMLGNFDRTGAYNVGQKTIPPPRGTYFVATYSHGFGLPFLLFTGLNEVQNLLKFGDIVNIYTDSLTAPSGFVFIVQSASQGAIASIISNTQTVQDDGKIGQLWVENVSYKIDNVIQWKYDWRVVKIDNTGTPDSKVVNLTPYRSPFDKLTDYILIPVRFMATQYVGIYFSMAFECDLINFNMRIAK